MDIVLTKLIVAHLLGDFFLQSNKWVVEKEAKKHRSLKLYLHVLIHAALMFLFLADVAYWKEIATITVIHLLIDMLKLVCQKPETKRAWFFFDQFLHLVAIGAVWFISVNPQVSFLIVDNSKFWTVALGLIFLTSPASLIIKMLIARWTPNGLPSGQVSGSTASLQSAGKYIGILERLLVFLFILINHWEAVGFLIAAKSIFRFGDLKEGNDLQLTEYILIGTLLSFGLAIFTAFVISFL